MGNRDEESSSQSGPQWFQDWSLSRESCRVGTTHTPERHIITGTVHVRADMTTKARIHQRNGKSTMLPWTPWAGPYEGLLGHHSPMKLNSPLCRVDLHDHHSIPTMGKWTLWSMSIIIFTWCPCMHTMMHWCVRYSPLVSAPRPWDGSMGYEKVPFTASPSWSKSSAVDSWHEPGATTGGCATFHKDKGRWNPLSYASRYWELYNEIGGEKREKNSYSGRERGYYFESLCREWPKVGNFKTHLINKSWAQVKLSPTVSFPVRTGSLEHSH